MEILAQPLCETLLPLDPTVFTPTTFRHTKRLPIRISKPSHKKFHFKNELGGVNKKMSRREAPRKDRYADVINELPDSGTYRVTLKVV
jgi:hypothetical protein